MLIVVHHCSFASHSAVFECVFGDIGMWICGIFFLQSGYALGVATDKYVHMNVSAFYKRRVRRILVDALIISALYQLFLLCKNECSITDTWLKLLVGNTSGVLPFSWFIWELVLLYLLYYVSLQFKHEKVVLWGLTIILMAIFYALHFGCEWYMSTLSFPLGVTITHRGGTINRRQLVMITMLSLLLYALYKISGVVQIYILIVPVLALSLNYLLSNVLLNRYAVFNKLAGNSFYIYMFQGFAFGFIGHTNSYQSMWLYTFLVLSLTILMSIIYMFVREKMAIRNR